MTDTSKTLTEQTDALRQKADKLEEEAREAGLLPHKVDEDENDGVGRLTGLVP